METAVRLPPLSAVEESTGSLLERVAAAGFDGVVLAGLEEPHLPDVASAIGATGLDPVGAHVPHDRLQAERRTVVRELRTVGCERVVIPELHPAHFETHDEVARMATRLSALGGRLAADGRTLCYHNHDHEFRPVEGSDASEGDDASERDAVTERDDTSERDAVTERDDNSEGFDTPERDDAYELLVERAGEGLQFEFDAGWAAAAGRDPARALALLDGRVPLVDVTPRVPETGERRLPGTGDVDLEAVAGAAADAGSGWLVHAADEPPLPDEELAAAADVLGATVE